MKSIPLLTAAAICLMGSVNPGSVNKTLLSASKPLMAAGSASSQKSNFTDPAKKVLRCKFKDLEANPCAVYVFDCKRFDNVGLKSLKKTDADLWSKLMVFPENGEGDFPTANPAYKGKTFEITFAKGQGDICNPDGSSSKGEVINILAFKLAGK